MPTMSPSIIDSHDKLYKLILLIFLFHYDGLHVLKIMNFNEIHYDQCLIIMLYFGQDLIIPVYIIIYSNHNVIHLYYYFFSLWLSF